MTWKFGETLVFVRKETGKQLLATQLKHHHEYTYLGSQNFRGDYIAFVDKEAYDKAVATVDPKKRLTQASVRRLFNYNMRTFYPRYGKEYFVSKRVFTQGLRGLL